MGIAIEHVASALRLRKRWAVLVRMLVLLTALLAPTGAAMAASLVVRFDEAAFGLREASAAADEARTMFLGLDQASIELTPNGAIFTVDPELRDRLADMFNRAMPADSRIIATVRRDGSVLVAYRPDLLRTNLPDINAAIPFVTAKLAAAVAGDVRVTALGDRGLEVNTEAPVKAETLERLLNESIGLQVRMVDCDFGADYLSDSTCGSSGQRFVDPRDAGTLWIQRAPLLTIDQFERWSLEKDPIIGGKLLAWRLTPEGARRFSAFTRGNTGVQVAFVLHGRVLVAPRVIDAIDSGEGVMTVYGEDQRGISELLSELKKYAPPLPFAVRAATP